MSGVLNLRETRGEISVEWEMKNFFVRMEQNMSLDSSIFLLSDAQWFLRIYSKYDDHWLYLLLYRTCSLSKNHIVDYDFHIKSSDGPLYKTFVRKQEFNSNTRYKGSKFFKSSQLSASQNSACSNGSVVVLCTLRDCTDLLNTRVGDASSQTSLLDRNETLAQNLKDLLVSERHIDTTIKVKNQEFKAHRSILTARSPVFNSMFDHNMVEKESGIVTIDDCDPDIIPDFLLFLYTGSMDQVTSGNASGLYKLSDKYDVKELKEECGRCMGRQLSTNSFCDVVLIASIYNDTKLMKNATAFFIKNWTTLLPLSKWQSFLTEHPLLANELFIKLGDKCRE